jgi:hypothetical protein
LDALRIEFTEQSSYPIEKPRVVHARVKKVLRVLMIEGIPGRSFQDPA